MRSDHASSRNSDTRAPQVNDILWLHRPYYTSDGVYTEGVVQYSILSIDGLIQVITVCV
jgi:hypothetical protein